MDSKGSDIHLNKELHKESDCKVPKRILRTGRRRGWTITAGSRACPNYGTTHIQSFEWISERINKLIAIRIRRRMIEGKIELITQKYGRKLFESWRAIVNRILRPR